MQPYYRPAPIPQPGFRGMPYQRQQILQNRQRVFQSRLRHDIQQRRQKLQQRMAARHQLIKKNPATKSGQGEATSTADSTGTLLRVATRSRLAAVTERIKRDAEKLRNSTKSLMAATSIAQATSVSFSRTWSDRNYRRNQTSTSPDRPIASLQPLRQAAQAQVLALRQARETLSMRVRSQAQANKRPPVARYEKCDGKHCKACSFHGDTLVLTLEGLKPIREIQSFEDYVWAKDEATGASGWRRVLDQYYNLYPETVIIDITHGSAWDDLTSQLVSNRFHPFFVEQQQLNGWQYSARFTDGLRKVRQDATRTPGQWIEADDLTTGSRLSSADGARAVVTTTAILDKPLKAYNITVEHARTYFVASSTSVSPVWVHNYCRLDFRIAGQVLAKIPKEWGLSLPSKKQKKDPKKIGRRWFDPRNSGNGVRIDQGNPESVWPTQRVDHVIVRSGGRILGRDGKPLPASGSIDDYPELAHIPLADYEKWRHWNEP
ncbi:MAG: polymorphic toxin-type HINT domain-containing protein [Hyphomicrobiaceae bacterium]|nr:polymorphic toxin-type HINT domain-containing protein [Hyphomicrobiaceae bacterium]